MAFLEEDIYDEDFPINNSKEFLSALSILIHDLPDVITEEQQADKFGDRYNIDLLNYFESMRNYVEDSLEEETSLDWRKMFNIIVAAVIYE